MEESWIYLRFTIPNKSNSPKLDLENNRIGDEGAMFISISFQINSNLTQLSLGYNQIGAEGAKFIFKSLQTNSTSLNLIIIKLELLVQNLFPIHSTWPLVINWRQSTKIISNSLQTNSTLTQLDLGNNNIGNEGAKFISNSLQTNPTLSTSSWIKSIKLEMKVQNLFSIHSKQIQLSLTWS